MKFLERLSKRKVATAKDDGHDKGRRGVLGTMVAGMAAYATTLFVSKQAHAACNCSNPTCGPSGGMCFSPQGLCYDDNSETYLHAYDIYDGWPEGQCCAGVNGLVCYDYCLPYAVC